MGLGARDPIIIGATALLISFVLTPAWQHLANRFGLTAQPGPRRVHSVPTPTGGGAVVFLALWGGLFFGLGSRGLAGFGWPVMGATAFLLLLGLLDDVYDLKPGVKLAGQIGAALIFVVFAGPLLAGPLFFKAFASLPFVNGALAVLWLVAMANIFNIIDGLDGLAGGLAVVGTIPLVLLSALHGPDTSVALGAALIGAVVGFLRYNLPPARLFLGDAGGMFVGFMIGILSLHAMADGAVVSSGVTLLAVAVPLFDTLFAVLRRLSRGQPVARADAMHTHHQLLRHGLSTPWAVGVLYAVGIVGALASYFVAGKSPWYGWLSLFVLGTAALPWARRLGVIGTEQDGPVRTSEVSGGGTRLSRLLPSESVDFHEETGKFQGIAK